MAVHHFSNATDRDSITDRVLDLAITGEAALLFREKADPATRGELTYRLALHAAVLAEGSNRSEVFRKVLKFYGRRGAIVHGGDIGSPLKDEALLRWFRELLRGILKRLLAIAARDGRAPEWEALLLREHAPDATGK